MNRVLPDHQQILTGYLNALLSDLDDYDDSYDGPGGTYAGIWPDDTVRRGQWLCLTRIPDEIAAGSAVRMTVVLESLSLIRHLPEGRLRQSVLPYCNPTRAC